MIRAVVGYALAGDAIGLARFREKYAPLMTGEADRLRVRHREQAGRLQQRRIRPDRQDGRQRRHARRLHPRNEGPLPGRHRPRAAVAGNVREPSRSIPAPCPRYQRIRRIDLKKRAK